jgi:carbamoyltransferase
MYVLGISCYYHDAAAALLRDGMLVAAAEEERFTRRKHDYGFPDHAIDFCLSQAGIASRDLDYVVFYEKPLLKFERVLMTTLQTFPRSWGVFRESMISWFNEKLWIKGHIATTLGIAEKKLLFVDHHLSHAASAFFCSPYDEAAILTVDGVGEWTTVTVGRGTAFWDNDVVGQRPEEPKEGRARTASAIQSTNSIELFSEMRFPHSLGLLYSAFTAFLGFRVNNGEYKVMGMAPYGRPTRIEHVHRLIQMGEDGGFQLNMDYFCFHHSTSRTFNHRFVGLFGEPRVPESTFFTPTTDRLRDHPQWQDATAQQNQRYADIAASIQHVTEETLLRMANYAHRSTGLKKLCMAGGVALNSVANGRILREAPFEDVWIQPAAGDSGGALGAALYAYHALLGQPRRFVMEHAYWGQAYRPDDVCANIEAAGRPYQRVEDPERLAEMVVQDLLEGKVIALFQGRFEWGPRALGKRSILADPRRAEMKEIVNSRIKFREPFRPFAPAILEERAGEFYAGLGEPARHYPFRYMLMVCNARDSVRDKIQAVTHADGTGRLQTVRRDWNPLYYRIAELFGEATGVPVLLNTSFNLRGEPIVNTPENALSTFGASDIDVLYLDGVVVRKATGT